MLLNRTLPETALVINKLVYDYVGNESLIFKIG